MSKFTDMPGFQNYHEITLAAMTKIVDCNHISESGAKHATRGIIQVLYTLVDLGVITESQFEKYASDTEAALKAKI